MKTAVFLICIAISPGLIAYMAGELIINWPGGADLFPLMGPDRIPSALAIEVSQIWIGGMGLALIATVAVDLGMGWWRSGRRG